MLHMDPHNQVDGISKAVVKAEESTMKEYLETFSGDLNLVELRTSHVSKGQDGLIYTRNLDPVAVDSAERGKFISFPFRVHTGSDEALLQFSTSPRMTFTLGRKVRTWYLLRGATSTNSRNECAMAGDDAAISQSLGAYRAYVWWEEVQMVSKSPRIAEKGKRPLTEDRPTSTWRRG